MAAALGLQVRGEGIEPTSWQWHAWLQCLPAGSWLQTGDQPGAASPRHELVLNFYLPPLEQRRAWRRRLRRAAWVFDPDPGRVGLLRHLGIRAHLLRPDAPANGWLMDRDPSSVDDWSRFLGLPAPGGRPLCLGRGDPSWEHGLAALEQTGDPRALLYLPGFAAIATPTPKHARLLAAWLQAALGQRQPCVLVVPAAGEQPDGAFAALGGTPPRLLPASCSFQDLLWELEGAPLPAIVTPQPTVRTLFASEGADTANPAAAVLISLHNYADRIERALESVRLQSCRSLELVVVDDSSSDEGPARAEAWLRQQAPRFARASLLAHTSNGGLASARNTAFGACSAPWAFVLDADNLLFPGAVQACLALTEGAAAELAVVHPLVEVHAAEGASDPRSLVSPVVWQRHQFLHGNQVDAMALVRRSAWEAVEGYTHISAGWEDFDFWCKLIDAGYHGVHCPRVLARYITHPGSMSSRITNRSWRALSHSLEQRHPWLELPLAR